MRVWHAKRGWEEEAADISKSCECGSHPLPLSGGLLKRARERGRGRPNGAIKGNEEMAAAGLPPPFLPPVAKASAYPGDTFNPSAGRFLSPLSLSLPPLKRACYVLSHLSE